MMLKANHKQAAATIFQTVPLEAIAAIQNDPLYLTGIFYVNSNHQQQVNAVLTNHCLALTEIGWFDQPYHYYATLDFELKFELITAETKIVGFRLHRGGAAPVQLRFAGEVAVEIWMRQMARLIIQLGFHQHFRPVKKLGTGGSATVYQVERSSDRQHFAVKAFSKSNTLLSDNPIHRLAVLNQIQIMRKLDSPNVIRLEAVYESENSLYIVLQLLSGQLHSLINRRQGHFTQNQIRQLMGGLAKGLVQIHSHRIIHRDIKPQNIMLRGQDSLQPVIADFGLATYIDADDYLFYRCGTPGYVAPEITTITRGEKADSVCDIFSAGVILHILLVRRSLFEGRKFEEIYQNNRRMRFDLKSKLYKDVDPIAMDLLSRMLRSQPRERIKAEQMLQHPFLRGWAMQDEKQSTLASFPAFSRISTAE